MQAFDPTKLGYRRDLDGTLIADGWDPDDSSVMIDQFISCAACAAVVRNIREDKLTHVAWHQRTDPAALIT